MRAISELKICFHVNVPLQMFCSPVVDSFVRDAYDDISVLRCTLKVLELYSLNMS